MRAISSAIDDGALKSHIRLLISNNKNSRAIQWAKESQIEALVISGTSDEDNSICLEALNRFKIDLILLTGYMRKIGQPVLDQFSPRIWNIHPALLPNYGGKGMFGKHVHKTILDAGETRTGASIQVVDPEYDSGPVILQSSLPIHELETVESLADKVKALECELLTAAIDSAERGELAF